MWISHLCMDAGPEANFIAWQLNLKIKESFVKAAIQNLASNFLTVYQGIWLNQRDRKQFDRSQNFFIFMPMIKKMFLLFYNFFRQGLQ